VSTTPVELTPYVPQLPLALTVPIDFCQSTVPWSPMA
jgi:hypothetical protein